MLPKQGGHRDGRGGRECSLKEKMRSDFLESSLTLCLIAGGEEEPPAHIPVKQICSKEFDPLEQGERSETSSATSITDESE